MAAAAPAPAVSALEFDRMEQIISKFFHKLLHAVIVSRLPRIHSTADQSGRSERRKRDRWFHLPLGDLPAELIQRHHDHRNEHNCRPHHPAGSLSEPMIVDIILTSLDGSRTETLVERWTVRCEPRPASSSSAASVSSSCGRTYKKATLMLRSLYLTLRLLPAHRVFQILCSTEKPYKYDIDYQLSSAAPSLSREEAAVQQNYSFAPLETHFGQIIVSVHYRPSLADFNFEIPLLAPSRIIPDYVDNVGKEPVHSISSSPATGTSASGPLRSSQDHDLDSLPSSKEDYGHILASAPALTSVPAPAQSQPRHSLRLRQVSPAENRFSRKPEVVRLEDISMNLHHYTTMKGFKAGHADDSGRYFSNSSSRYGVLSRLPVHDDLEDGDSYPFTVDGVSALNSRSRSSADKVAPEFEISGISEDAAVGVLVNMFRTAPPLRQDESSFRSSETELKNSGTSSLILSRKTSDALEELQGYKNMKNVLLSRSEIKSQHSQHSAEGKTGTDP